MYGPKRKKILCGWCENHRTETGLYTLLAFSALLKRVEFEVAMVVKEMESLRSDSSSPESEKSTSDESPGEDRINLFFKRTCQSYPHNGIAGANSPRIAEGS